MVYFTMAKQLEINNLFSTQFDNLYLGIYFLMYCLILFRPKDAIKAIRKRLTTAVGKNYTVVMYTLTVSRQMLPFFFSTYILFVPNVKIWHLFELYIFFNMFM